MMKINFVFSKYIPEPLVAYMRKSRGSVHLLPRRIDPDYLSRVYGYTRIPHLDPPRKK